MPPCLSIVIPVGPGEAAWRALLGDLQGLPVDIELLLVGVEAAPAELDPLSGALAGRLRWLRAPRGRAIQQNAGAAAARGDWLCFLHADSRLDGAALRALGSLARRPPALYYFELGFFDGPVLLSLNALGANLRSRLLGLPFGDQGLSLTRADFVRLGGFDESLRRAEDHALVWAAHRAGLRVRSLGVRLLTSGRRYGEAGWLRTTLRFFALSFRQARAFSRGERA
ncbi:Glycosyl transferase family 2 [Aquimonas voraii]|uniref:Glycosyl transferase family 2 n=2 Tax=Aquimonas voraii TaxID=265719 RepID=A0A1G7AC16_9GAMM|nr:Glycosyl transferase family 2 [Aquimonas voraii]